MISKQNKTIKIAPGFITDKKKLFIVSKIVGNRLDKNFIVIMKDVSFRFRILLKKIFIFDPFWNKSSKTKASNLERTLI